MVVDWVNPNISQSQMPLAEYGFVLSADSYPPSAPKKTHQRRVMVQKTQIVGAQRQDRAAAFLGQNMVNDTPEQLWQRIVREHPRASDEDIQCRFIAALYVGKSLSGSSKT
jgi:hypothetical protein